MNHAIRKSIKNLNLSIKEAQLGLEEGLTTETEFLNSLANVIYETRINVREEMIGYCDHVERCIQALK